MNFRSNGFTMMCFLKFIFGLKEWIKSFLRAIYGLEIGYQIVLQRYLFFNLTIILLEKAKKKTVKK